jgi:hypothetical protein
MSGVLGRRLFSLGVAICAVTLVALVDIALVVEVVASVLVEVNVNGGGGTTTSIVD